MTRAAFIGLGLAVICIVASLYTLCIIAGRILAFFGFTRDRRVGYIERTNREAMVSRMPYRPGSIAIAARTDGQAADSLIQLTRQRPAAM